MKKELWSDMAGLGIMFLVMRLSDYDCDGGGEHGCIGQSENCQTPIFLYDFK